MRHHGQFRAHEIVHQSALARVGTTHDGDVPALVSLGVALQKRRAEVFHHAQRLFGVLFVLILGFLKRVLFILFILIVLYVVRVEIVAVQLAHVEHHRGVLVVVGVVGVVVIVGGGGRCRRFRRLARAGRRAAGKLAHASRGLFRSTRVVPVPGSGHHAIAERVVTRRPQARKRVRSPESSRERRLRPRRGQCLAPRGVRPARGASHTDARGGCRGEHVDRGAL